MSSSKKRSTPASSKKGTGQKTLFSFFAKKPTTETPSSKPAAPKATSATRTPPNKSTLSSNDASSSSSALLWQQVVIGSRISVYWPNDDLYYNAIVTGQKKQGTSSSSLSTFTVSYDDGEMETIDLATEQFRFLSSEPKHKRRRIASDEEEEEFEFHDEASSSPESEGSAYVDDPQAADNNNNNDEEDQWMVTDDEDDMETIHNKKKKKQQRRALQVTHHVQEASNSKLTPPKPSSSSGNSTSFTTPKMNAFAALKCSSSSTTTTTPAADATTLDRKVTPSPVPPVVSQSQTMPSSSSTCTTTTTKTVLPYVQGALNPAGSHLHNHLKFLQHPKDLQGRSSNHPEYDSKTLKVDYNELGRHYQTKSGLTPASRQWWELKAHYFDSVLFFKTGKFYELYHVDADIGVNVLNFTYMKGHVAHAGFPEISYGIMAEKLVAKGYKVARVEQTETPEMLKMRKQQAKGRGGKAPQVVNREVCSILTSGTRTFCYLDDTKGLLDESSSTTTGGGGGPLLAIREVLLETDNKEDAMDTEDDDEVRPMCEYGITLVDAIRATVTIGQFADDVLRSRMNTLLTTFAPSEILVEGGENGVSPTLLSLIRSFQATQPGTRMEYIHTKETFPKSTAVDVNIRRRMERKSPTVQPWDVQETLEELHRRGYYPRASRQQQPQNNQDTSRWPKILHAAVEGKAELALSSYGAALFYLQRNLIDQEILGMGIVKAYAPPASTSSASQEDSSSAAAARMSQVAQEQHRQEDGLEVGTTSESSSASPAVVSQGKHNEASMQFASIDAVGNERDINHLALDGTTLQNLEVLANSHTHTVVGSLWSKINYTKSPHGSRLLRAWLLRPLFRKAEIDRRADAVEELVSGASAMAMSEARGILSKCGDIERLLSRVHSMGGVSAAAAADDSDENSRAAHPNKRAVLYETATHTKRKVGDFSKVLNGLRHATQIPELFAGVEIQSGLLRKIVQTAEQGGCFPDMTAELDWFFDNFDCEQASNGLFEPSRGMDETFDEACDAIERIQREFAEYKDEMCSDVLKPSHLARSKWKYVNTKDESKDKYLIELPVSVRVPDDFLVKGKRGKGDKQILKYRTPVTEQLVQELEHALDVQKAGKARGMQLVFSKFDSVRNLWAAAAQATAMLDALGSLAQTATKAGYTRPTILDCPPESNPRIHVVRGRHPCVDITHNGGEFIPNDLTLGSDEGDQRDGSRVLLLSGPNMGGKSTLLRQTCLIAILAQVGCYVPAEECALTPIDRIYTRLGASDRILLGQSTFFVELAETAAALRGATRRSLVIMDELGRGTSTFDGTAIASAAVKHLVEQNKCLTLFATHYHSLLNDWKDERNVTLGHMECIVEGSCGDEQEDSQDNPASNEEEANDNITFLYTLGEGACPKSFGINVARLAALPEAVLSKAKRVSSNFEAEMSGTEGRKVTPGNASHFRRNIQLAVERGDWAEAARYWNELQS